MQTLEYHTADKLTWGDGPWQDEPDKMQFPDPETGLPCLIVRNGHGALCGYVGVPEGHKYHGVTGWDFDLRVHGGITFTDRCHASEDEAHGICHIPGPDGDNVWWLGFDCSHYRDFAPGLDATIRTVCEELSTRDYPFQDIYRDIIYVKAEIASLAKQLVAV